MFKVIVEDGNGEVVQTFYAKRYGSVYSGSGEMGEVIFRDVTRDAPIQGN